VEVKPDFSSKPMCATCLKESICGLEIIDLSIPPPLAALFLFFSEGDFATCLVSNRKRYEKWKKRTLGIFFGCHLLRKIFGFGLICKDKPDHTILVHSVQVSV
jgi:hypothetical protein